MQVFGIHRVVRWEPPRGYASWWRVSRALVVLALPLGVTELFWTSGTFLYNVVFQQISDDALAAAQIVNMLEALFLVGSIGLMAATTALVGLEVGRGDGCGAAAWVRRIKAGTVTGIGSGCSTAPPRWSCRSSSTTRQTRCGRWRRRGSPCMRSRRSSRCAT